MHCTTLIHIIIISTPVLSSLYQFCTHFVEIQVLFDEVCFVVYD